jgi:hypothetical protein
MPTQETAKTVSACWCPMPSFPRGASYALIPLPNLASLSDLNSVLSVAPASPHSSTLTKTHVPQIPSPKTATSAISTPVRPRGAHACIRSNDAGGSSATSSLPFTVQCTVLQTHNDGRVSRIQRALFPQRSSFGHQLMQSGLSSILSDEWSQTSRAAESRFPAAAIHGVHISSGTLLEHTLSQSRGVIEMWMLPR